MDYVQIAEKLSITEKMIKKGELDPGDWHKDIGIAMASTLIAHAEACWEVDDFEEVRKISEKPERKFLATTSTLGGYTIYFIIYNGPCDYGVSVAEAYQNERVEVKGLIRYYEEYKHEATR